MCSESIFAGRLFDPPFTQSTPFQTITLGILVAIANALDHIAGSVELPINTVVLKQESLLGFLTSLTILLILMMVKPKSVTVSRSFGCPMILFLTLTLVAIGGIVCAVFIPSSTRMIGRCVQGMIGGGIVAITDILTTDTIPPRELEKHILLITIIKSIGAFVGFMVGGMESQGGVWRWIGFLGTINFLKIKQYKEALTKKLLEVNDSASAIFFASATAYLVMFAWIVKLCCPLSWLRLIPVILGLLELLLLAVPKATRTKITLLLLDLLQLGSRQPNGDDSLNTESDSSEFTLHDNYLIQYPDDQSSDMPFFRDFFPEARRNSI